MFTILTFQKVTEMWNIMKYMTNVTPFPKTQDPLKDRNHKTQLVEQAKKYLEDRYKEFMSTVIKDHLRDAQRGGIPSTMNLVNAFVGFKFNNQSANSIMGKTKCLSDLEPSINRFFQDFKTDMSTENHFGHSSIIL